MYTTTLEDYISKVMTILPDTFGKSGWPSYVTVPRKDVVAKQAPDLCSGGMCGCPVLLKPNVFDANVMYHTMNFCSQKCLKHANITHVAISPLEQKRAPWGCVEDADKE